MHKHNWVCSDVPGVYECTSNCGFEGVWTGCSIFAYPMSVSSDTIKP